MKSVREALALQARLEVRIRRGMQNAITRAMRSAAAQIERDGGTSGLESALADHALDIRRLIEADYRVAAQVFGDKLRRELGLPVRKDYDPFDEALQAFLRTYGATKVQQIASTTKQQIVTLLREAEIEGLGVAEAARIITRRAPAISAIRAATIARTETHTAAMFGQQAMAQATGLELNKQWVTVEDNRARSFDEGAEYDHVAMNGETVRLEDMFQVPGQTSDDFVMFPGDPSGDPANIINCRCAMVHIPV